MIANGKPIVDRIRDFAERKGFAVRGPVGVVSTFSKEMRVDEPSRDVLGVATTDDIDLEEEVIVPSGADMEYFKRNKKVFVDHNYDTLSAVGVMRNLKKWSGGGGASGWLARIHVPESPDNPIASHILALARAGGIGLSIGFEAIDFGRPTSDEQKKYPGAKSIVRQWKWIELSFTAMPCNVACQSLAATMDDSKAGSSRLMLTKGGAAPSVFRLLNLELPVFEVPRVMFEVPV